MSLGRGAVMCKSSKQKLNTKSSTEAELVGASDYLPNTIWAKMFLESQGYILQDNRFLQDNQSAIKLEINGRASCGQKSRHIDIRYFFMKDRVKTEGIDVVYCPTEEMLADFFTKPLQGSLFIKFKKVVMGEEHISTLQRPSLAPGKERVEDQVVFEQNMVPGANGRTPADVSDGWQTVKSRKIRSLNGSRKEMNFSSAVDVAEMNRSKFSHSIG